MTILTYILNIAKFGLKVANSVHYLFPKVAVARFNFNQAAIASLQFLRFHAGENNKKYRTFPIFYSPSF